LLGCEIHPARGDVKPFLLLQPIITFDCSALPSVFAFRKRSPKALPAGKLTANARQEECGTKSQEVTINAAEAKTISISFQPLFELFSARTFPRCQPSGDKIKLRDRKKSGARSWQSQR